MTSPSIMTSSKVAGEVWEMIHVKSYQISPFPCANPVDQHARAEEMNAKLVDNTDIRACSSHLL